MKLKIAAIRSGADPGGPLPGDLSHSWLEMPLTCPKCDVTYNLVAASDQASSRFFERESSPLIGALQRAIAFGHIQGHKIAHFETTGGVVKMVTRDGALPLRG
jgi:hypothetical protein